MSELADVPGDVLTSAMEAARDVGRQLDAAHRRGSPGTPMAAYVIAHAIMAERERCFKAVLHLKDSGRKNLVFRSDALAAIRKSET